MVSKFTSKRPASARGYLCLALSLGVLSLPAQAEEAARTLPREAGAIVTQLLDAVRERNAPAAFAALSVAAQEKSTRSAETYITTLRVKQQPLYNHAQYHVLDANLNGTSAIQRVELQDREGKKSLAIIRLGRQPDGTWRIEGTVVIPPVSDTPCDCNTRGA